MALLVAYLAIGAIAADALTRPRRDFNPDVTPATLGLAYEEVRFPARDGHAELAAWYIPAGDANRAVVMVHGRDASRTAAVAGNFVNLAKALHDAGFAVLMIDLRGHGQSSEARFTFGLQERYDVLGAVDWLRTQGFKPGSIGVFGLSLGAAAGIGAAANEPAIGALATDSAFADLNTLMDEQWEKASGLPRPLLYAALFAGRLLTGSDLTQARPVAEIGAIAPRPLLLIHCRADSYVPFAHLEQLQAVAPGAQIWTLETPACLHSEGYNLDPVSYADRLAAFFAASLR
jgi:dipeptidyl aminopeptidase/acylaminoacyl peptidase